jgi:hypothetical protein
MRSRHSAMNLSRADGVAAEAPVRQQVTRGWAGLQQVRRDVALADGGGHDGPGADDAAAQVGLHRQPEAVEPLGVGGVAAELGDPARRR